MDGPVVLRAPELKPHTLVRIRGEQALRAAPGSDVPAWVTDSLQRAPWVVVRRAQIRDGLVPVGVRGDSRQQRFGAWLAVDEALEAITPQALASCRTTTRAIPALSMLPRAEKIMCEYGLGGLWGPSGSVGFELASGVPVVSSSSDLDLVLALDRPELIANRALSLWTALAALPVRVDVLLETSVGAAVLCEYVRVCRGESRSFVLRTPDGPRLVQSA
jgi:phosphoribosyl-dephospho-CoA transferase